MLSNHDAIRHVFANRSNVGDWLSARGIQALLAPERRAGNRAVAARVTALCPREVS